MSICMLFNDALLGMLNAFRAADWGMQGQGEGGREQKRGNAMGSVFGGCKDKEGGREVVQWVVCFGDARTGGRRKRAEGRHVTHGEGIK